MTKPNQSTQGKLFVTAGLGGMSGAQPKAGNIAGVISVTAEVNPKAARTRHEQGWVDEVIEDLDALCERVKKAKADLEVVSIAYLGNIVDVWEARDRYFLKSPSSNKALRAAASLSQTQSRP